MPKQREGHHLRQHPLNWNWASVLAVRRIKYILRGSTAGLRAVQARKNKLFFLITEQTKSCRLCETICLHILTKRYTGVGRAQCNKGNTKLANVFNTDKPQPPHQLFACRKLGAELICCITCLFLLQSMASGNALNPLSLIGLRISQHAGLQLAVSSILCLLLFSIVFSIFNWSFSDSSDCDYAQSLEFPEGCGSPAQAQWLLYL